MFKVLLKSLGTRQYSTIFALSSGQGKCGVAVIRVSGPSTTTALKLLTSLSDVPTPRKAILRTIKHPHTLEPLDKGLILWFPGEDCCEFHVHGGIAVINSVLDALSLIPSLKLAAPGEFTRRAFYNGKLDLTEVEGLADLLQAETEAQRKQAFLQTQGSLSKIYNKWKDVLVKSVAQIEAYIDFEETETIDLGIVEEVTKQVKVLVEEIQRHLDDGRKGELLRNGVKAVIVGEPNVGKSSLLNLLCNRPAAIVTPLEGTTRDILEVHLNIGGYPLILSDTAGLRNQTSDVIEREGIQKARETLAESDLVILVIDSGKFLQQKSTLPTYLNYYINKLGLTDFIVDDTKDIKFTKPCIIVFNKSDLVQIKPSNDINLISCQSKAGVSQFVENLSLQLKNLCGEPSVEHPSMNQTRHRQYLNKCLQSLNTALKTEDTVLIAEHLRRALKHLGTLVGATTTEQLLDIIFKDFCIGK